MTQFLAVKVAIARKDSGVAYPAMYAEGAAAKTAAGNVFNCVQRAHQNTIEYLPNALTCQMLMGLKFPVTAAAIGVAWTLGRLVYAAGYSTGDPSKRGPGSAVAGLAYLGLIGGCAYAGYSMLF
jgi:glutathione S-transferase